MLDDNTMSKKPNRSVAIVVYHAEKDVFHKLQCKSNRNKELKFKCHRVLLLDS